MTDRTISLQVKILSDDPRAEAPERVRMETQRALALWLGPENVYVQLDDTATMLAAIRPYPYLPAPDNRA